MLVPESTLEKFDKIVTRALKRAIKAGTSDLGAVLLAAMAPPSPEQAQHTGAMIALVPSDADLDRLVLPDGESRDQLHLTLHFLGTAADMPPDVINGLNNQLESWASIMAAVPGFAWNVGYFNPTGEEPCVALGIGGPMLDATHDAICGMMAGLEWEPPEQHLPWIPHITLAYDPADADFEAAIQRLGDVTFDTLRFAVGDTVYDYPLGERAVTAAAQQPSSAEPYISLDDLAAIETAWRIELAKELLPALGKVYVQGAEETLAEVAANAGASPLTLASRSAEVHLAEAQNRLARVGTDLWQSVRVELVEGMQAGEDVDQLAKRVRGELASSSVRAKTIARTEVISASNAGSVAQVRALGFAQPKKVWIATEDGRTRPSHREADGQTVDLSDTFTVGDANLDFPGDPRGPADEIVNCRCTVGYEDVDQSDANDLEEQIAENQD